MLRILKQRHSKIFSTISERSLIKYVSTTSMMIPRKFQFICSTFSKKAFLSENNFFFSISLCTALVQQSTDAETEKILRILLTVILRLKIVKVSVEILLWPYKFGKFGKKFLGNILISLYITSDMPIVDQLGIGRLWWTRWELAGN